MAVHLQMYFETFLSKVSSLKRSVYISCSLGTESSLIKLFCFEYQKFGCFWMSKSLVEGWQWTTLACSYTLLSGHFLLRSAASLFRAMSPEQLIYHFSFLVMGLSGNHSLVMFATHSGAFLDTSFPPFRKIDMGHFSCSNK